MISQNQKDFLINHIIDQLTKFILQDNEMELPVALNIVYQSRVYQLLVDEDSFLYSQSPSYIYELLKMENDN